MWSSPYYCKIIHPQGNKDEKDDYVNQNGADYIIADFQNIDILQESYCF